MGYRLSSPVGVASLAPELVSRISALGRSNFETNKWLPYQLLKFPDEFRGPLLDRFEADLAQGEHVRASLAFYEARRNLDPALLSLASDDSEICNAADKYARTCRDFQGRGVGVAVAHMYQLPLFAKWAYSRLG